MFTLLLEKIYFSNVRSRNSLENNAKPGKMALKLVIGPVFTTQDKKVNLAS